MQWTGQWMTRPHALLVTKNLSSVDQWVSGLSRGARRTLKKAEEAEHSGVFSVQEQDIRGGSAPLSSPPLPRALSSAILCPLLFPPP
eukprot:3661456-Rhodomonas_salina.1